MGSTRIVLVGHSIPTTECECFDGWGAVGSSAGRHAWCHHCFVCVEIRQVQDGSAVDAVVAANRLSHGGTGRGEFDFPLDKLV